MHCAAQSGASGASTGQHLPVLPTASLFNLDCWQVFFCGFSPSACPLAHMLPVLNCVHILRSFLCQMSFVPQSPSCLLYLLGCFCFRAPTKRRFADVRFDVQRQRCSSDVIRLDHMRLDQRNSQHVHKGATFDRMLWNYIKGAFHAKMKIESSRLECWYKCSGPRLQHSALEYNCEICRLNILAVCFPSQIPKKNKRHQQDTTHGTQKRRIEFHSWTSQIYVWMCLYNFFLFIWCHCIIISIDKRNNKMNLILFVSSLIATHQPWICISFHIDDQQHRPCPSHNKNRKSIKDIMGTFNKGFLFSTVNTCLY